MIEPKIIQGMEFHNADCMAVMSTYPDKHFDLAIVDPPYGIETRGNAQDRFSMGKSLSLINDAKPNRDYFNELFRVSKNQIIWGYNHLSDMLPSCREFVFWYKRNPVVTFSDGELAWTSFQKTAVCFDFSFQSASRANGVKIHPTQKPAALYGWLLSKYAKPGFKILDTHLGSGSIAIACYNHQMSLVGCELDKHYFDAAMSRIEREAAQVSMF